MMRHRPKTKKGETRPIVLKTPEQIAIMKRDGRILRDILLRVGERVRPGVTTLQLDRFARRIIAEAGAVPSFLGYQGFPAALCVSVNDEVVHGIPSERVLIEGDIVSVDCGIIREGLHVDSAMTFPVGEIDAESERLIRVTRESLEIAIPYLRPGLRQGDLSAAVQKYVEARGFSVVRDYAGHGVGHDIHEEPRVPNHGKPGTGVVWRPGMVVAIEPMVAARRPDTKELDDKWTVITADGGRSAHWEHTIAVTEAGPLVLTD